jgi:hypothetical protein
MQFVRHVKRPEWGVGRVSPDPAGVLVEFEWSEPRRFRAEEARLERVAPPVWFVPFGGEPRDSTRGQGGRSEDIMDRGRRLGGSYGCGRRR